MHYNYWRFAYFSRAFLLYNELLRFNLFNYFCGETYPNVYILYMQFFFKICTLYLKSILYFAFINSLLWYSMITIFRLYFVGQLSSIMNKIKIIHLYICVKIIFRFFFRFSIKTTLLMKYLLCITSLGYLNRTYSKVI